MHVKSTWISIPGAVSLSLELRYVAVSSIDIVGLTNHTRIQFCYFAVNARYFAAQ